MQSSSARVRALEAARARRARNVRRFGNCLRSCEQPEPTPALGSRSGRTRRCMDDAERAPGSELPTKRPDAACREALAADDYACGPGGPCGAARPHRPRSSRTCMVMADEDAALRDEPPAPCSTRFVAVVRAGGRLRVAMAKAQVAHAASSSALREHDAAADHPRHQRLGGRDGPGGGPRRPPPSSASRTRASRCCRRCARLRRDTPPSSTTHSALHQRQTCGDGRMLVFYTLVDERSVAASWPSMPLGTRRRGGRRPHDRGAVDAIAQMSGQATACRDARRPARRRPATTSSRIEAHRVHHRPRRRPQPAGPPAGRHRASGRLALVEDAHSPSTWPSRATRWQTSRSTPAHRPASRRCFDVDRSAPVRPHDHARSARRHPPAAAGQRAAWWRRSYADPEYVYQDLEQARALMRKLGCIVVHTENRAVEETAQEILRYYERAHPPSADMMG